jgi:ferrochelatase
VKTAVVLFNLGGPDSLEAVEPFLRNLFSDPAVISLPAALRIPVARFAARRRAPFAREIYAKLGGKSPINEETHKQSKALEALLQERGVEAKCFVAMRCWRPLIEDCVKDVKGWGPDRIVLLPLYPQFSTTTTASSFGEWDRAAGRSSLNVPTQRVCCYPAEGGFIDAMADLIHQTRTRSQAGVDYRLLLSAHGLPERTIARGDPYRSQVELTAKALVEGLGIAALDWQVCFQSRVGPLSWIGAATDAEIRRAGAEKKGVIVMPIAFVSEHSETLVELDMEYAELARESGVPDYLRVPTVGVHAAFIAGLAGLVEEVLGGARQPAPCGKLCGHRRKEG